MRKCERCGTVINTQEAHIVPKALFPMGENSDMYNNKTNRMILCEKCHNIYDHLVLGCLCRFIREKGLWTDAKEYVWRFHKWWIK